jgi:hypothetical protein
MPEYIEGLHYTHGSTYIDLGVLHEICDLERYSLAYEQVNLYANYPNIFTVKRCEVKHHPLYRSNYCRYGDTAHCPMGGLCVDAHTRGELRPVVEYVYKIRLTRDNRELLCLTTPNDVVFGSKDDAYAYLSKECLHAIENGVIYDTKFPALESMRGHEIIQHDAVISRPVFNLCAICEEAPRTVRFGCGHSCMCEHCLKYLMHEDNGRVLCPVCRIPVVLNKVTVDFDVAWQHEFIRPDLIPQGRRPDIPEYYMPRGM